MLPYPQPHIHIYPRVLKNIRMRLCTPPCIHFDCATARNTGVRRMWKRSMCLLESVFHFLNLRLSRSTKRSHSLFVVSVVLLLYERQTKKNAIDPDFLYQSAIASGSKQGALQLSSTQSTFGPCQQLFSCLLQRHCFFHRVGVNTLVCLGPCVWYILWLAMIGEWAI